MNAITYSNVRSNLAATIDRVCQDHAPVIITKKSSRSVVMVSLDDYEAMQEAAYLMQSPENARRLLKSLENARNNKGVSKSLKDLADA
ncbi:MAG: type II toxin-antitoxin system prevent-host-death family antitoxin [Victivallaceae bacterium]|nr:type II toxin-antitoxin system prevent-host-death family antitoxin [Victivallaceae bacterium]